MADDDSLLTNPPSQDAAWHVHDYLRFTRLVKLVTGIVLFFTDRLTGGNGTAGLAAASTAGNAAAVPAIVAAANPALPG